MNLDRLEVTVHRARILAIVIVASVVTVHIAWFFLVNGRMLSADSSDWGTFGDFIGGLLNPAIAYMAFYWLTVSVLIQKTELSETRIALTESRDAQRDQARSTEKAMRMQAITIQLEAVNTELRSLYEYRSFVLEHGSGPNINYQMLTRMGAREKADNLIHPLRNEIAKLEAQQQILIETAKRIATEA